MRAVIKVVHSWRWLDASANGLMVLLREQSLFHKAWRALKFFVIEQRDEDGQRRLILPMVRARATFWRNALLSVRAINPRLHNLGVRRSVFLKSNESTVAG